MAVTPRWATVRLMPGQDSEYTVQRGPQPLAVQDQDEHGRDVGEKEGADSARERHMWTGSSSSGCRDSDP